MKIKNLKIKIAMALTVVMMGYPIIKASANQINLDNTTLNTDKTEVEITYENQEYVDFLKDEFKKEYGTENKFKTIYEDNYVKEEVNGATTEFKTTNKETKEVDSYNYFDTLDQRLMNEEESIKHLQEQIDKAKEDFQKQYGTENKFKVIYKDNNTIEEVNGATGEYKITDLRTRNVTDTYNYFDELKEEINNIGNIW